LLSDLKRIHSHICSVAYPVLEAAGELPALGAAKSDAAAETLAYQPKLP
jgi:phosphate:Na+ symporter